MKSVWVRLFGIGSLFYRETKMLKFVVLFALVIVSAQAGKWDRFSTFEDALAFEEANYDFDLFHKVRVPLNYHSSLD